jgi:hypothetical protein
MANTNSELITNVSATPPVKSPVGKSGGKVRIIQDVFTVPSGNLDTVNDTVMLARLPSHARVIRIRIANDDLDSDGTPLLAVDLGIYPAGNTTAAQAKDQDYFASAITQLQAISGFVDVFDENRTTTSIQNTSKQLWEMAGDSADEKNEFDIGLTVTVGAGTAAAGSIAFQVWYVLD